MFVLWTRARDPQRRHCESGTPPALIPSAGSGITGHIDNYFWERFGSAILMSFVLDSISAATKGGNSGGTNIDDNTANSGGEVVESIGAVERTFRPRGREPRRSRSSDGGPRSGFQQRLQPAGSAMSQVEEGWRSPPDAGALT